MTTLLLFGLAFVAVMLVAPLAALPLLPLMAVGKAVRALAPVVTFATALLAMACAMLAFEWSAAALDGQSNFFMYALPCAAFVSNDMNRVRRAWSGATPVRTNTERAGGEYDPDLQARMEVGSLLGDLAGFWGVYLLSHG